MSEEPVGDPQIGEGFRHLTEEVSDPSDPAESRALLRSVTAAARKAGPRAVSSRRWLVETTIATAEHLPVRDLEELQRHHRGLSGPMLGDALVRNASMSSAGVGAGAGALITAQQMVPPSWWVIPFELAAETAIVVAIELKLLAELHEAYGRPVPGAGLQKGAAIATAWSQSRGVQPADLLLGTGATDLVGRQTRTALATSIRRKLSKRLGRSLGSVIPVLIGAGVAAELNRRATQHLGRSVQGSISGVRRP